MSLVNNEFRNVWNSLFESLLDDIVTHNVPQGQENIYPLLLPWNIKKTDMFNHRQAEEFEVSSEPLLLHYLQIFCLFFKAELR